jgi:hypothetical protein
MSWPPAGLTRNGSGHTGQHRLSASPLSAAAVSGWPSGPGADLAENLPHPEWTYPEGQPAGDGQRAALVGGARAPAACAR